jgi:hypothetical protein
MPNWKKVIVSGSGISQLSNDANYLAQSDSAAILSGSFSGSFVGDGSQLSGVTSYVDADTLAFINSQNVVSGSSQVTISDTDGFGVYSGSVKSYTDSKVADLSGSLGGVVNPLDNRIDSLESFSSSLDATYATDAEVSSLSGSAHTQRVALNSAQTSALSSLSGSAAAANASLKSNLDSSVSSLSGSAHTANVNLKSDVDSSISSLSGSAEAARQAIASAQSSAYIAADTALSSSAHTDRVAKVASLSGSAHTQREAIKSGLASDISSLSGSAHGQREAIKSTLNSDIGTES